MEKNNTKKSRALKYEEFSRSPVDIIIPFHGQYERVKTLVKSILIACRSNPYQICLVDDASPNKEWIKNFQDVDQVMTVQNEQQMGFGASLQIAILRNSR